MSRLLDDPIRVQDLVASFLSTQRTTRNNVNPYFIPPDITMEKHYQSAMDSGMDPREYDRRTYHGTSSSQPFPYLAHFITATFSFPRQLLTSTSMQQIRRKPCRQRGSTHKQLKMSRNHQRANLCLTHKILNLHRLTIGLHQYPGDSS